MKALFLFFVCLFSLSASFSQKLPQSAIIDFGDNLMYHWKYGNGTLKAHIYLFLRRKGYSNVEIPLIVETTKTNAVSRELMFELIANLSEQYDFIHAHVYSLGVSAISAKQITDYIFVKYKTYQVVKPEKIVKVEPKSNLPVKNEYINSDLMWKIQIIITGPSATLQLFYGVNHPNYDPKYTPVNTEKFLVKDSSFYTLDGRIEIGFIKNKNYYQANTEGGWNKYELVR